jgi:hypothetical protein
MQATTRTSWVVSRFGRIVGVAAIAVGAVGNRDAAAWSGVRTVTVSPGDSARKAGTTTLRSGGGGALATLR